jgi:hypothetical protein
MRMEAAMRHMLIVTFVLVFAGQAYADQPQTQPDRGHVRSFGYARLGYGGVFADDVRGAPAFGFGYRGELESFALDVSFLNFTVGSGSYTQASEVFAGSLLRLQALRFLHPQADRSVYVGGGMSWGALTVGRDAGPSLYGNSWHGNGLQGEVTVGYELPRASQLRMFVQADLGLPIFYARSDTVTYPPGGTRVPAVVASERRYIPSAAVTIGIGWQRNHP